MKRLLLLAALLAGCDDESIPARVAAAQIHGIVEGEIHCTGALTRTTSPFDTTSVPLHAQRLLDGSCFVNSATLVPTLLSRSNPDAETCSGTSGSSTLFVEDGVVVFIAAPGANRFEGAVETVCTGFGFEAFGVE